MTREEAKRILLRYYGMTVEEIYDEFDDATEAVLVLHPFFEYPDWAEWLIEDYVEAVSRYGKRWSPERGW